MDLPHPMFGMIIGRILRVEGAKDGSPMPDVRSWRVRSARHSPARVRSGRVPVRFLQEEAFIVAVELRPVAVPGGSPAEREVCHG